MKEQKGRIFCLIGKSASGKDTLYQHIMERHGAELTRVIPSTTRPIRTGETDGVDYHFVTKEQLDELEAAGKVIECRSYQTVFGMWYYFTMAFEVEEEKDYIVITTLEGAHSFIRHFGVEKVRVVYLDLEDRTRLMRCVAREDRQKNPNYNEVCRRFLADQQDFAPEKLAKIPDLQVIHTEQDEEGCLRDWEEIFLNAQLG